MKRKRIKEKTIKWENFEIQGGELKKHKIE
jgi:hypothetical protein